MFFCFLKYLVKCYLDAFLLMIIFSWMLLGCFFFKYYLDVFCLCFKCLKFLREKKKKLKTVLIASIYILLIIDLLILSIILIFILIYHFYFYFHFYFHFRFHSYYYYYYFNYYNQYLNSIIIFLLLCLTLNLSLNLTQNLILIQCL